MSNNVAGESHVAEKGGIAPTYRHRHKYRRCGAPAENSHALTGANITNLSQQTPLHSDNSHTHSHTHIRACTRSEQSRGRCCCALHRSAFGPIFFFFFFAVLFMVPLDASGQFYSLDHSTARPSARFDSKKSFENPIPFFFVSRRPSPKKGSGKIRKQ